ncbi:Ig-like domain-containing protein [Niabella beijingensis]|uniref:Ig-like domain-containing protein n=1 Tax=Niabella beijingensis TaxID=2872700 RepID=UPI001CC14E7D|nr:Ig-like domain-containing protein [Niabella beijingensis]MBZ4188794.1 DUF2268 domain-containing putative Zn-dependent protease [Niabella beijingensis]
MRTVSRVILMDKKTGRKKYVVLLWCLCFSLHLAAQNHSAVVTTDINNFWETYDSIRTTNDSAQQRAYLDRLFITKGTPGLQAMMKARRYTPQEYIDAINKSPEFWTSLRKNTSRAGALAADIETGTDQLRSIYPELKPATTYFTMGVFRSGGTTAGDKILIGSEIIFADEKKMNSLKFTAVHELVHTQQKTTETGQLLAQSVMEGVAEFLAVMATGTPSAAPAIGYGKRNEERVKKVFASQMFSSYYSFWLYSDATNEFDTRDLGYYVGYAIAEKYYEKAKDKKQAIREMIELDYSNSVSLAAYVDASGYFSQPVAAYAKIFEKKRPGVISLEPFKNGNRKVSPGITRITITFSTAMHNQFRNFELGPLGKEHLARIKNVIGFSEDGRSISLELEALQPNKKYQLVIGSGFRDQDLRPLHPYLIDFTTGRK